MKYGFLMQPSYYEAIRPLPDDQRLTMLDAILDYAFAGKEPNGLPPILQGYFTLMQPNIDSSIRNYSSSVENGKKGGRPKKETQPKPSDNPEETQPKPSDNPEETQPKPSDNQDKDRDKDKDRGADKPLRSRFVPPTLAEVQSYVSERHSPVDPQGFIDFYESKGWMVGRTPMKDWKAACRNAESWDRWKNQPEKAQRRTLRLTTDEDGNEVAVYE